MSTEEITLDELATRLHRAGFFIGPQSLSRRHKLGELPWPVTRPARPIRFLIEWDDVLSWASHHLNRQRIKPMRLKLAVRHQHASMTLIPRAKPIPEPETPQPISSEKKPRRKYVRPTDIDALTMSDMARLLAATGYIASYYWIRELVQRGDGPAHYYDRTALLIRREDALSWAATALPRCLPSLGAPFEITDLAALAIHIERLHRTAAGSSGNLIVTIKMDTEPSGPTGWEQERSGMAVEPVAIGEVDRMLALVEQALAQGYQPAIPPALFLNGQVAAALGIVVVSRRPDLLTRLPFPASSCILHDDRIEAHIGLTRPQPIDRIRHFARLCARETGGFVFPGLTLTTMG